MFLDNGRQQYPHNGRRGSGYSSGKKHEREIDSGYATSRVCRDDRKRLSSIPPPPPLASPLDRSQYVTDEDQPYRYGNTGPHGYHSRKLAYEGHSITHLHPPPVVSPSYPSHFHQYHGGYISVPPIPTPHQQNRYKNSDNTGYCDGQVYSNGWGYQPLEEHCRSEHRDWNRETQRRSTSVPTAEVGAARRNSLSESNTQGHDQEQQLRKVSDTHFGEKDLVAVKKATVSKTTLRDKGSLLRELELLRFTPKVTAGAHMRRFERMVELAYPGVSSAKKWSTTSTLIYCCSFC